MARYTLLGINVDLLPQDEIFARIRELGKGEKSEQVVFLDTYLLVKACTDKALANMINSAALVIPVSQGVLNGLKFLTGVNGTSHNHFNLIIRLLSYLTDFHENIYVLGGKNEATIHRAENNIRGSFPGIRLMGSYHMSYKKNFEKNLITAMQKTSAALIIVSTARPKQELWISRNKKLFPKGVFIGVENFVDIIGSKDKNASYANERRKIPVISKNFFRIFFYIHYAFLLLFAKMFAGKKQRQVDEYGESAEEAGVGAVVFDKTKLGEKVETDVFGDPISQKQDLDYSDTVVKEGRKL